MADLNTPEYFKCLERELDSQQAKVCLTNKNTVVAAGAGSGKTYTLATRFAYLIMSENIDVKKILTLTFTNKAAAEMYKRIYSTLDFFVHLNNDKRLHDTEKNRAKKST